MHKFPVRLAGFLVVSHLKKYQLAIDIGVTPQTITNWLKGRKPQKAHFETLIEYSNGYISWSYYE